MSAKAVPKTPAVLPLPRENLKYDREKEMADQLKIQEFLAVPTARGNVA